LYTPVMMKASTTAAAAIARQGRFGHFLISRMMVSTRPLVWPLPEGRSSVFMVGLPAEVI
jgi:hypothetical protein